MAAKPKKTKAEKIAELVREIETYAANEEFWLAKGDKEACLDFQSRRYEARRRLNHLLVGPNGVGVL